MQVGVAVVVSRATSVGRLATRRLSAGRGVEFHPQAAARLQVALVRWYATPVV